MFVYKVIEVLVTKELGLPSSINFKKFQMLFDPFSLTPALIARCKSSNREGMRMDKKNSFKKIHFETRIRPCLGEIARDRRLDRSTGTQQSNAIRIRETHVRSGL